MIRRVAFKKAIAAGVAGAAAWEAAARAASAAGLPIFDLTRTLGTMVLGSGSDVWEWWPLGTLLHCTVGAIWSIFYAYFFWSTLGRAPVVQGLLFSILPTLLAGLVMVPQLDLMHSDIVAGRTGSHGMFAINLGLGGPATIIFGHLIFGIVLGIIYVRPVGYPVGKRVHINV